MYTPYLKEIVSKLLINSPKCQYMTSNHIILPYIDILTINTSFLPKDCKLSERIYCIHHNILERPKCYCKRGGYLVFKTFLKGYRKHCSKDCSNQDPKKIQYAKSVCMQKWGYPSTAQSPIVTQKFHDTCLNKYGVSAPHKNKLIRDKFKNTMKRRYGKEYSLQNSTIMAKFIKTSIKKYGVNWPSKDLKIKQKILRNRVIDAMVGNNEIQLLHEQEIKDNCTIIMPYKMYPYTLDGYCKETNTAYEVYERYHTTQKQKDKDKIRQNHIQEQLKCNFVIIWDLSDRKVERYNFCPAEAPSVNPN